MLYRHARSFPSEADSFPFSLCIPNSLFSLILGLISEQQKSKIKKENRQAKVNNTKKKFRRGEKDRRRWNRERHPRPSPPPQSPHLRVRPQPQKGASSASQQSATELVVPPKKPRLAREPPPDPTTSLPKLRSLPNSQPSYPAPP